MPEISTAASSRIFYHKTGSGPALMLVHGFPESGNLWRLVQEQLSASFTLIIPDLPGAGRSTLNDSMGMGEIADCLLAVLDHEGVTQVVIAGHSMGGYAAFEFAARYPSHLAGLSLVHSIPYADDGDRKTIRLKAMGLIENGGKDAFTRQLVPNLFSPSFKQTNPEAVEEETMLALGLSDHSMINFYHAMIERRDNTAVLNHAAFPLQWIIGADDSVIPSQKIFAHCHTSAINFVSFYNDCGHMSMIESPTRLADDLQAFTGSCYNRSHK